ncbi:hypothetical protein A1Q2_04824 [Trichosporon asahii var. asahii CBS 8904]|uniref:Ricin B lectin domain-containing protein n=2 Tax=Trichosporon asahii var. asahii TaxID=189963 RepID=K1VJL4_TRIAC|nr:hypothetical protein A1Q1_01318 [Trichosporon asahii var. asahii CBS 2479]EJT52823.1 hypothetical protein A1Q1_01318 [Trichosporon asahii var. asahii CBS 2479]EKD00951.1 hypothetical protein A1Q2_04824 [Trichosporon asahii var. asahii CBS 8904]
MLASSLLILAATVPALAQVEITKSINLRNSKLCLDNKDGNQSDGNRLQVANCDSSGDQQWNWVKVQSEGDQLYNIKLDNTDKCLAYKVPDQEHGSASGAPVVLASCNSDPKSYYVKWRWDKDWICSGVGEF